MRKIVFAYYFVRFVMAAATAGFLYYDDAEAVTPTKSLMAYEAMEDIGAPASVC